MAGDIGIAERLVTSKSVVTESSGAAEPILHEYGPNVRIALSSGSMRSLVETVERAAANVELTPTERLGADAFQLRLSEAYQQRKAARPNQGASWDGEGRDAMALHREEEDGGAGLLLSEAVSGESRAEAPMAGTSDRLKGRAAVAVIMVSGVTPGLALSADDQVKVVAEVQNGLGWLGAQSPSKDVTFVYETHHLTVSVPNDVTSGNYEAYEAPWRDAAMSKLGVGPGLGNVRAYVQALRTKLKANWAYCAFFTRYNLRHFAYAGIGGPRLVMHFENDGWGTDNIDRVFAHETGHIFGAPDEYASSGCDCGGSWGYHGKPNSNCANCAPGGGVDCLMGKNSWAMCDHTKLHLGF